MWPKPIWPQGTKWPSWTISRAAAATTSPPGHASIRATSAIADVALIEACPGGEVVAAAAREIVHDGHFVPCGQIGFGHMRADEARPAGHQDSHSASLLARCAAAAGSSRPASTSSATER